jgi:RND family efflux transporter MFP subunit
MTMALRLAAVLLAAFTISCAKKPEKTAGAAQTQDPPTVAVVKAVREDMLRELVLTAEFKPFQEVDLMAKVAGYVKKIHVDVGDRVRQGQLLAVLEVPEMNDDLERGRAAIDRSQAEVSRAKDDLHRAESVYEIANLTYKRLSDVAKQKPGLVARQEIDDAESKARIAEAQVRVAKSSLVTAERQVRINETELQRGKTMLDYTRVIAPFDGVITKRYADTGSMLQAGTSSSTQAMPLVRLSQNSRLRLILPVPESAVPSVHIGQRVEVRVPTLNREFPGVVARFAERVSSATRTMETEVDVFNESLILIPGMYAEVQLAIETRPGVVAVPTQAVESAAETTSGVIAVVTPGKRIEFRPVKLGLQTASTMEVRSGLKAGELVVVGSRAALKNGQSVNTKITAAMNPPAAK